jgi:NUMOD3 motif
MITKAYLYKWTHIPSSKWYIGSRTKSGSHPEDGYICSSKAVKPMILESPSLWVREILAIGNPGYIRELESKYLSMLDARNDVMSFNLHNGDGKFTTAGTSPSMSTRTKMRTAKVGKCIGVNNGFYGKKHTPESIEKSKRIGSANGMFGKFGADHPAFGSVKTDSAKKLISDSKKGDRHPSKNPAHRCICENCGLETYKSNYKRWHGINCKRKIK